MGDLRLFYVDPGGPSPGSPMLLEVEAGELQEPIVLMPVALGAYVPMWYGNDRWLVLTSLGNEGESAVFDTSTPTPLTTWPLGVASKGGGISQHGYAPISQRLALLETPGGGVTRLQIVTLGEDGPSAPFDATAGAPATLSIQASGSATFSADEQRIVFRAEDTESELHSLWIAPAVPDGGMLQRIAESPDPTHDIYASWGVPGSDHVVYAVDDGERSRMHLLDTASSPALDTELEMLPDSDSAPFVSPAPDGSGLLIRERHAAEDDYAWTALVDGVPQAPVQIDVGDGDGDPDPIPRWSADGRWLHYGAGITELLVHFEDGVPGEPQVVATADSQFTSPVSFAPGSDFAYFAAMSPDSDRIVRIALDDELLGDPEPITDALDGSFRQMVLSPGGQSLTYIVEDPDTAVTRAYFMDLSGNEPGPAIRMATLVDQPGPAGLMALDSREYAIYGIQGMGNTLVDLVGDAAFAIADGRSISYLHAMP